MPREKETKTAVQKEMEESLTFPDAPTMESHRRIDIGEAIAQAITLLDKGDIKKFSNVAKHEELTFALWLAIAKKYKLKSIERFIFASLCLRVSIDGKGREDIVRIASANSIMQQETESGMMSRFRGMIGI